MAKLRRDSKAEGTLAPKPLEDKVKALNEDWGGIASSTADLFAARVEKSKKPRKVEVITATTQMSVQSEIPQLDALDWGGIVASRPSEPLLLSLACDLCSYLHNFYHNNEKAKGPVTRGDLSPRHISHAATCRVNSNQFEFMRHVVLTKCRTHIPSPRVTCTCDMSLRQVCK